MASQHLVSKVGAPAAVLGSSGPLWTGFGTTGAPVRYGNHNTAPDRPSPILGGGLDPVITLSQLAAQLGVSVHTLYDLRSQGRGPRGFRVGRELRFRVSEIAAWLARMEADAAERHPREAG